MSGRRAPERRGQGADVRRRRAAAAAGDVDEAGRHVGRDGAGERPGGERVAAAWPRHAGARRARAPATTVDRRVSAAARRARRAPPAVDADAVHRRRIDRGEPLVEADTRRGHPAVWAPARVENEDRHAAAGAARHRRTRASAPRSAPGTTRSRRAADRRRRPADRSAAREIPRADAPPPRADRRAGEARGSSAGPRRPPRSAARPGVRADHSSAAARARRAAATHSVAGVGGVGAARRRETCWCGRCRPRRRDTRRARRARRRLRPGQRIGGGDWSPAHLPTRGRTWPSRRRARAVRARCARAMVDRHAVAVLIVMARPPRRAAAAAACSVQRRRPCAGTVRALLACRATSKSCTRCTSEESLCTSLAISRWMKATILQSARIVVHNSYSARAARPGWISAATRKERIGLDDGICSTFRSRQKHP